MLLVGENLRAEESACLSGYSSGKMGCFMLCSVEFFDMYNFPCRVLKTFSDAYGG
jgi:hypothetical protein